MTDRAHHRQHVEALLNEIEHHRHEASIRRAGGVQPAGLRDLKAELRSAQAELAAAVSSAAALPA